MSPLKRIKRVKKTDIIDVFKCSLCSKIFQTKSLYDVHMAIHNGDLPYSCDICNYRCRVKKYLSRHKKKVHTKANGPSCNVCGKVFHYSSSLRNHMRVHTGERPFHCEVCNKSFNSTYCLSMHRFIHTNEKPFQCSFCDYACRDNSTLRRHEERHMGVEKTYPCHKCKKTYNTKSRLRMHVDEVHYGIDLKQIPCEHCDRKFKSNSAKNSHIKTVHDRLDRSQCEICDRVISRNNISAHLKTHVDIRPYSCSFKNCHKQFKDRGTLKKHTLIHYPELYFQCDLCDSRFVRKTRLRDHKKWHVNNGYTCDYCGGSFLTKSYLQTHITRKHLKPGERYVCDECESVHYTKQSIILHLKYGHGHRDERNCRICGVVFRNNSSLSEHYLKIHKVRYIVIKKEGDSVTIKKEPKEDLSQNFIFDYEVQKTEVEDGAEPNDDLSNCNRMVEVDISPNIINTQNSDITFNERDEFKTIDYIPEYADTETTLAYSEKVLEEDLSRSMTERKDPDSTFEEFYFKEIVDKSKRKKLGKEIIDKNKLVDIEKTIDKMLKESRMQKAIVTLEEMRQNYNRRIVRAYKRREKKEPSQIKYFKKPQTADTTSQSDKINDDDNSFDEKTNANENMIDKDTNDELMTRPTNDELATRPTNDELVTRPTNDELVTKPTNDELVTRATNDELVTRPTNDELVTRPTNDELVTRATNDELVTRPTNDELVTRPTNDELVTRPTNDELVTRPTNDELVTRPTNDELVTRPTNDEVTKPTNDELATRPKRTRKKVVKYTDEDDITNKNGKVTFDGHECYVCFKVFRTKEDLKFHCKEHFDICNEKMLKKCPFCGYVTNLNIKRHIEIVHKININYDSAHIAEKPNATGSKYVFRIDKDCELEIIPSISNLNKIAGMKVDEKRREQNNLLIRKTKLIKKGDGWVVEKQAIGINSDNILPEFTEQDYAKIKLTGTTYFDRLRQLSVMAKNRGAKMLYPCESCEKICQSLAALKLHNRKHEENPKQFKPKVWVNRNIEYKTKNRKKIRNKSKKTKETPPSVPVNSAERKSKTNYAIENRYAAPQPVKNNHKCDKKLIEFYKNNIRGKDIEFWQFLKIFNKINRENVNDFEDLVNRDDVHFGIHTKDECIEPNSNRNNGTNKPVTNKSVTNKNKPVTNRKSTHTENKKVDALINKPVITGKSIIPNKIYRKNVSKNMNRTIIISKKENIRRNAIKDEMRQRLAKNNI